MIYQNLNFVNNIWSFVQLHNYNYKRKYISYNKKKTQSWKHMNEYKNKKQINQPNKKINKIHKNYHSRKPHHSVCQLGHIPPHLTKITTIK